MNEKEKYIGVFDSGIGGLTCVKSIIELLPNENIIYFGDTAHVPYGTRSASQIKEYVLNDVKFLSQYNLKAIVIACNTADSVGRSIVEKNYKQPVIGVVKPASKEAVRVSKNQTIGVMATNATVNSKAYEKEIMKLNPNAKVISIACPLLVPLVENGRYQKGDEVIESILHEYIDPLLSENIDTLVLGCTHYPVLESLIRDIVGNEISIVSSSHQAAITLKELLNDKQIINDVDHKVRRQYFVSDKLTTFNKQAKVFMGKALKETIIQVDID